MSKYGGMHGLLIFEAILDNTSYETLCGCNMSNIK
jgi:hypothetical protein